MGGHFNAETVGTDAFDFVGLIDSFWHGFILSFPPRRTGINGLLYLIESNCPVYLFEK